MFWLSGWSAWVYPYLLIWIVVNIHLVWLSHPTSLVLQFSLETRAPITFLLVQAEACYLYQPLSVGRQLSPVGVCKALAFHVCWGRITSQQSNKSAHSGGEREWLCTTCLLASELAFHKPVLSGNALLTFFCISLEPSGVTVDCCLMSSKQAGLTSLYPECFGGKPYAGSRKNHGWSIL